MKIQFDGEVTDIQQLMTELKAKGLQMISVETSRWLGKDEDENPIDRGGRIDVEISDDHILEDKIPATFDIQIAMIESDKTTVIGDVPELKREKEKRIKKLDQLKKVK